MTRSPKQDKPDTPGNGRVATTVAPTHQETTAGTLEQATALRTVLREAVNKTSELIRALKRDQKQSRLVRSTLASLKQIQAVENPEARSAFAVALGLCRFRASSEERSAAEHDRDRAVLPWLCGILANRARDVRRSGRDPTSGKLTETARTLLR